MHDGNGNGARPPLHGLLQCGCTQAEHVTRLVAVTGGPGAGKTALLHNARYRFCEHVAVLPEVATMLFANGFPRMTSDVAVRAAQRAIFSVQREIERCVSSDGKAAIALCDRGTIDGLAYWPGAVDDFFSAHATSREVELARYAAVIHLRTPSAAHYDHKNAVRIESAAEARRMDERIQRAWSGHPRVHFVESTADFVLKMKLALTLVEAELPPCCAGRSEVIVR